MRPEDLLQFYKARYTATVTTDNNCTINDSQADTPDTYTASIGLRMAPCSSSAPLKPQTAKGAAIITIPRLPRILLRIRKR